MKRVLEALNQKRASHLMNDPSFIPLSVMTGIEVSCGRTKTRGRAEGSPSTLVWISHRDRNTLPFVAGATEGGVYFYEVDEAIEQQAQKDVGKMVRIKGMLLRIHGNKPSNRKQ